MKIILVLILLTSPALSQSMPDPTLTPGSVRTSNIEEVCSVSTSTLRHWSRERDDSILAEYSIPTGPHPLYEIDHLIPLCLGGSDDNLNLWPQPRRSIEPEFSAEAKDRLEARVCQLACAGSIDIAKAQRDIAEDWVTAYQTYVKTRQATTE